MCPKQIPDGAKKTNSLTEQHEDLMMFVIKTQVKTGKYQVK